MLMYSRWRGCQELWLGFQVKPEFGLDDIGYSVLSENCNHAVEIGDEFFFDSCDRLIS